MSVNYFEFYWHSYESSDGQKRQESGYFKRIEGVDEQILVVTGSYSYYGTDGFQYRYEYISDENGYRVSTPVAVENDIYPEALPQNAVLSLSGYWLRKCQI